MSNDMMSPRSANSSRSLKCHRPHRQPGSEQSCLLAPAMRECVFFVHPMASQEFCRGCSQGRSPHWQVIDLLLRTHPQLSHQGLVQAYILKAGFAGFQNPQTIWNFPQKDCQKRENYQFCGDQEASGVKPSLPSYS